MKAQEHVAAITDAMTEYILSTVARMPEEKRAWKPSIDGNAGRSALDMLGECVVGNENWTETIVRNDGVHVPPPQEAWALQAAFEHKSLEEASAMLREVTSRLTAAIRAMPDDSLDLPMESPWFAGMKMNRLQFANFAHENMAYHCGQISYIQTLYGDQSM